MYQRNQKTWYKHFDFMFLDFLCIEISFYLVYIIRFGIEKAPELFLASGFSTPYRKIMVIILCLHIAMILFTEPYSGILKRNAAEETKKVFQ